MCSSVGSLARTAVQPIAQISGADLLARKTLGKSVTNTLTPKDKIEYPKVATRKPYKGLAIGTQVGGTRKPLGSNKAGLNL